MIYTTSFSAASDRAFIPSGPPFQFGSTPAPPYTDKTILARISYTVYITKPRNGIIIILRHPKPQANTKQEKHNHHKHFN